MSAIVLKPAGAVARLAFAVLLAPAALAQDPSEPTYVDPPGLSEAEQNAIDQRVSALIEEAEGLDYERARYHPIHFQPAILEASDRECLVCHADILGRDLRAESPAGLKAGESLAWYQTLATYDGSQQSFHRRHMATPYADAVMNLQCNFCHVGNDPREESPDLLPAGVPHDNAPFTMRKLVNPSETCLRCHGAMPNPEEIMLLPGPWPEVRADFEYEDEPNGCLSCHRDLYRLNRHNVTYLNAATIEDLAQESSDVCYGCHGGRAWYMISYPYPRHSWPDMDEETPEWALDRPTESDPRFQIEK